MIIGPNGDLLVLSFWDEEILRFDTATGAFIDVFIPAESGGMRRPTSLLIGPDSNLHILCTTTDSIYIFDGNSGAFINAIELDMVEGWGLRFQQSTNNDLFTVTIQSSDNKCEN